MFRIRSISLYRGSKKRDYSFSDNAYVYGPNSVGKTALTKVIDFVLGSSDTLSHDGLDNIEGVIARIENNNTTLWIKRNVHGEYFYKRTEASGYSQVSVDIYKATICGAITENADTKAIKVYQKVFDENPTYRSFSFINFVDEIGQGDLGAIFTRGKEVRHLVRIRNIMDFFFNYENIEKIYQKRIELDELESEHRLYLDKMNQYTHSVERVYKLFSDLGIKYSNDMSSNYKLFKAFQADFTRERDKPTGDLVYLTKASHSLSEELKLYYFLKEQSNEASSRKQRTEQLLYILKSILADNSEYAEEIDSITNTIKQIQKDKLILSLADYDASIEKIKESKKRIDSKISYLKGQSSESDYERTLKLLALIEEHFEIINSTVDFKNAKSLEERDNRIKKRNKNIKE